MSLVVRRERELFGLHEKGQYPAETCGIINIAFRIKGRYLRMNCRIVRNLVYDLVLGWDFFVRYKCSIHPSEGHLSYENEKIPLVTNSLEASSSHFALAEDAIIPPMSKMLTEATFYINPKDNVTTTDTVEIEPLRDNLSRVAVGRNIAKVKEGRFIVELLNPYDSPLTVKSSVVLGHISFTTDEELAGYTEETDIILGYGGEDSGYESAASQSEDDAARNSKKKKSTPKRPRTSESSSSKPPAPTAPPDVTTPKAQATHESKPTAKPAFDYSTIAEDAKPSLIQLKHLLE